MITKEIVKAKISQIKAENPNTRIDEAMFTAGVRFAEAEMKSVAIDFAKFTGSINKLISCWDSEEKVWRRYNNGAVEKLTDKQVFDIFMAERNNQ